MRLSLALTGGLALALALPVVPARAHVAPAVGDNNRYLKLTPLGDRVRLAYTVFYGEIPGAGMRGTIDANHDGAIDDSESQAFGTRLAGDIARALEITVDGKPQSVVWSQVVVGMGSPQTTAGAFSVDLVAWVCLTPPRGKHVVLLRDHYAIERPGETEVKVEDSPGVTIHSTRIGGASWEDNDYKLVGPSGALETEGFELDFTAGDKAAVTADGVCAGPARRGRLPVLAIVGAAAAAGFVLAAAVMVVIRLRRRAQRR
ncbi:MAG TPA: hypothetical protein VLM79_15470 [Kofleriaceae bacterium]|nr:hypothetical protein [Kofleriaceae bacterium]